jgi:hypothetical protein
MRRHAHVAVDRSAWTGSRAHGDTVSVPSRPVLTGRPGRFDTIRT